mmetsp:Transcript_10564/g.30092  ORF Transcript_10564/g.30092 Transcript_10564/m.30092 type:complete len:307 (+) Transcript_10564:244-1164(+)
MSNWTGTSDVEGSGWSCFSFVAPIFPTFSGDQTEAVEDTDQLDVFILAGQSNMSGRGGVVQTKAGLAWDGVLPEACLANPKKVLRFTGTGKWEDATEPAHQDIDSSKVCGVGPGMAFANELLAQGYEHQIGLVPCAIGGTRIDLWKESGKLFANTIHRTSAALASRPNARLRGLLWYQGESDADTMERAQSYQAKLEAVLNAFRTSLNEPTLPILQVAIDTTREEVPYVNEVRKCQFAAEVSDLVTVDARGFHLQDGFHLSTHAQCKLGKEMALTFLNSFPDPSSAPAMDAPPVDDMMANGRQSNS